MDRTIRRVLPTFSDHSGRDDTVMERDPARRAPP